MRSGAPDTVLISVVLALTAIGVMMIYSASNAIADAQFHDASYYLKRQLAWLVVAVVCAVAAYRCDYRKLKRIAPFALGATFLALILVFIPHVGFSSGGARRWLGVGALSFQPSEFAKLTLVVYLATALTAKGERVRSFHRGIAPLVIVTAILALLVLLEPDMGTASLLIFTTFAMLFAASARITHIVGIALATLPLATLFVMTSPYKRARLFAFVDPWKDAQNTGFHIVQSLLALGSGGPFGLGLGLSRQKFFYLPEQHTDFIFSIIGEELGMLGGLIVIALFVILAFRAMRIALASPDRFGYFLSVGCVCMIVIQAFINIGVVTGSWPVTGVPLPFISFGGSSLVVSLVAVALIANVGRRGGRLPD